MSEIILSDVEKAAIKAIEAGNTSFIIRDHNACVTHRRGVIMVDIVGELPNPSDWPQIPLHLKRTSTRDMFRSEVKATEYGIRNTIVMPESYTGGLRRFASSVRACAVSEFKGDVILTRANVDENSVTIRRIKEDRSDG